MRCERLDVWKRSCRLSVDVYRSFASCKDYGFKDQITRSSLSIASNIAEGMEKESDKDKNRFINISQGSAAEFATQTYIGIDIGYIDREEGSSWIESSDHILSMLSNLQTNIKNRNT